MGENVKERLFDSRGGRTQALPLGHLETSAACISSNDSHYCLSLPSNCSLNLPIRNSIFVSKIWQECQRLMQKVISPGKKLVNKSRVSYGGVLELRGIRSAATARSAGVGIAEFEATAVKAVYIVDGRTL